MSRHTTERVIQKLGRTLYGWKSDSGIRRVMQGQITCLLYHRVVGDGDRPWVEHGGVPVTRPEAFRQHLSLLKRIGCRFFTLQQIATGEFPEAHEAGVVITFDDGFADNFEVAQPILDDLDLPAVFFVAAGLVDSNGCNWDHQVCWYLSHSEPKAAAARLVSQVTGGRFANRDVSWIIRHLLTPAQVQWVLESLAKQFGSVPEREINGLYASSKHLQQAIARGHEIGSHTVNHPMRHTLPEERFVYELTESKRILELALQRSVTSFSYPFNSFLFTDGELCRQSGYSTVATVEPGRLTKRNNLLEIPRRTVFRAHNQLSAFKALLCQERWGL